LLKVKKYSSDDILYVPFIIFRVPLFHKPVTGRELFLAVFYSKPALVVATLSDSKSLFAQENIKKTLQK
jgi:hypothetical protein